MFNPQYQITNKMLMSISKIEAAEEVIRQAPLLPLWEKQFKDDAVVRAVYHGTHIEGNRLGMEEAKDVLMGRDIIARPRDIQEIINYRRVMQYIDDEATRGMERITEQVVMKLHRLVVDKIMEPERAGQYRSTQVVIKNSENGQITFRPPPPLEVPYLMREYLYWMNKDDLEIHPILKAGIVHHEFVRIHPFVDGNGRVGRALTTLGLFLGGYDIRRFFSLEEFYDRDAATYYEHLQKASAGDLTAWLEYFSWGASIEFDRVKEKVLKISRDAKTKERIGGKQIFLNERQIKIIEYINDVGYVQNKMFGSLAPDVSEDTMLRDIKDLIAGGLIKKVGSTKSARYILT